MNEAARVQLEKEIEKQTKDAERFQQDAQAEINELQQEVQNEFVKKLSPIVEQLAKKNGNELVIDCPHDIGSMRAPSSPSSATMSATPSRRPRASRASRSSTQT